MFQKNKNWVIWKAEKRAGKITKIPYTKDNKLASSTDPHTWCSKSEALKARDKHKATGVGTVLPLDGSVVGIDLDKCLENNILINYKELVEKAETYTEYSPSGTGLHLFFQIEDSIELQAHRSKKSPGFEVYQTGRYFTYTGNRYNEFELRTIKAKELNELLSLVGYPWKEQEVVREGIGLSQDEIVQRMFKSKNGAKIERIYNGDVSEYNDDVSAADMALCMHLAFWTQKNQEQIRSIWLKSPLGSRKKTQERKDYQDMTIAHAIAATNETYSPTGSENIAETLGLQVSNKDVPYHNLVNICKIMEKDDLLSSSIRYNEFRQEAETTLGAYFKEHSWHPIDETEISFITLHIQTNYPFFERIARNHIKDSVLVYARDNRVNPPVDWIKELEWDGEHRLDHWLSTVYGVADDAYHSSVGANWFMGMVKRVVHPGCKFDHMIILEGAQGWKKSTSMYIIGKGYHAETILTPDNKDFFMLLKDNIIVEFSEGHTMGRSDTRILKSVITSQDDNFRVPFGRAIQKYPRHCVFAMTTNESQYLRDDTGNRRFLPVELKKVADVEWLENNVDQLYAEAYQRVIIDGEKYWEFPEDETKAIQESRMVENAYSNALIDWYADLSREQRDLGITALEAYQAVWLGGAPMGREMHMGHTLQVTNLFTNTLKMVKRVSMVDGVRNNRWFATDETESLISSVDTFEDAFTN